MCNPNSSVRLLKSIATMRMRAIARDTKCMCPENSYAY